MTTGRSPAGLAVDFGGQQMSAEPVKPNRHLYNSGLGKVAWFIRRFGFKELFRKPWRMMLSSRILKSLPDGEFCFDDTTLRYFYHRYNCTWANERCVEIPIACHYLTKCDPNDTLEVGNVLSHYFTVPHQVVDKFERGEGVINCDILDFKPDRRFQLIISISTFEHIGLDDSTSEGSRIKIPQAMAACRALLAPSGKLLITAPIGYNHELDNMITDGTLGPKQQWFLRRVGQLKWTTSDWSSVANCRYGTPYPYANAIMVGEF